MVINLIQGTLCQMLYDYSSTFLRNQFLLVIHSRLCTVQTDTFHYILYCVSDSMLFPGAVFDLLNEHALISVHPFLISRIK